MSRATVRTLVLLPLLIAATGSMARATLEGGTPFRESGLEPRISVRDPVVGKVAVVTVSNLPPSAGTVYLSVSRRFDPLDVSDTLGPGAVLVPDVGFDPAGFPPVDFLKRESSASFSRFLTKRIGPGMAGQTYYVQALVEETGNPYRYVLTDGIEVTVETGPQATLRTAGALPVGRANPAVAHDDSRGVTYIFGGDTDDPRTTDKILVFDSGKPFGYQLQVLPDRLPSPRSGVPAVWDTERGVAYVLGGPDPFGDYGEIVVFDPSRPAGQRISMLQDTLPLPSTGSTAVWDPSAQVVFVFAPSYPNGKIFVFDPDGSPGNRVRTLEDQLPDARGSMSSAWDPTTGRAYLFGGSFTSSYDEILEFDPTRPVGSKIEVLEDRLPTARTLTSAVWDENQHVALVIGGARSDSERQVVRFDPSRSEGSRVSLMGTELIEPATSLGAIYDPARDCTVLIGGRDDLGGKSDQIWVIRAHEGLVRRVDQYPRARYAAAACVDPDTGVVYSFGGRGEDVLDEIVAFGCRDRLIEQTVAFLDTLPTARYHACAVWDPVREVAYVFGGRDGSGSVLNEVLQFDPHRAPGTRVSTLPDAIPFPLSRAQAVWDDVESVVYVIGGNAPEGEILRFDPALPPGARGRLQPIADSFGAPRINPGVVWDSREGVAYIFGGAYLSRFDEIVEFDPRRPSGQRLVTLTDRLPTPRTSMAAVWSSADHVAYLLGGDDSVGEHQLVRFDPRLPSGQRVSVIGSTPWEMMLSVGVFDPVARLPVFLGGFVSINEGRSSVLLLDWE